MLLTNASLGYENNSPQGSVFLKGQFDYDDTWRWGFNINRASSADYIRDFRLGPDLGGDINLLTSQVYLEGFGVGAYSRLDTKFYQATNRRSPTPSCRSCCRAGETGPLSKCSRWLMPKTFSDCSADCRSASAWFRVDSACCRSASAIA